MNRPKTTHLALPSSALFVAQGIAWAFDLRSDANCRPTTTNQTDASAENLRPQTWPRDVESSRPAIVMTQAVYTRVLAELLRLAPEAGGALIGPKDTELVTHYLPNDGEATPTSFTLDHTTLNRQLATLGEAGLDLKGIVHSHPAGVHSPSRGDWAYLDRLLSNPKNRSATSFSFPIVCDGRMWPYVALRVARGEIVLRSATLILV